MVTLQGFFDHGDDLSFGSLDPPSPFFFYQVLFSRT